MSSLIASAYQKLVRAKAHCDALHELDRRIVNSSYQLIPEPTDDPDEIEYRLRLPRVPDQYPMLVADCIHNLRCVLDHLVSQLAEQHEPERPLRDKRRNQFPICETLAEFEHQVNRGRLNGLPQPLIDLVASMQPFHAGFEWLGVLNELENQDKHRGLLVTGSVARSIFSSALEAHGIVLPFRSWADAVLDGAVFVRLHRRWATTSFDQLRREAVEARGTMQVLFLEGAVAGWNVPNTVQHFTDSIERAAVPRFRPHFVNEAG